MQIKPKKKLGQNFLKNPIIIEKIISCGSLNANENILEVGPGTGNLTERIILRKPKNIYVVEKDKSLCELLKDKFINKLILINDDILNIKLENLNSKNLVIFGNLPYNISTKILTNWILNNYNFSSIKRMILMFQKEVADRILGQVNDKNYGRLSIIANWKFKIKKEFDIGPKEFFPRPKIDSTVLSMVPKENFFNITEPHDLEKITSIFFNQRRKMIKKTLNKLFDNNSKIIEELNIDTNLRPQNISPEVYFKLAELYRKSRN